MDNNSVLKKMLIAHEGYKHFVYRDQDHNWTIGVGHDLRYGLPDEVIDLLLEHDISVADQALSHYAWYPKLCSARKLAFIDMMFNLGPLHFAQFHAMLAALDAEDFDAAGDAMVTSEWAHQVGGRALQLAKIVRKGVISE